MRCTVPETGVEPARLLGHTDLNRARLPIPPPGQKNDRKLHFCMFDRQGINLEAERRIPYFWYQNFDYG